VRAHITRHGTRKLITRSYTSLLRRALRRFHPRRRGALELRESPPLALRTCRRLLPARRRAATSATRRRRVAPLRFPLRAASQLAPPFGPRSLASLEQAAAGALLGFCTGYALKQAGRTLALLIGFGVRPS
jgi:hypothetical protein